MKLGLLKDSALKASQNCTLVEGSVNSIYYRDEILPIYVEALKDQTLFPVCWKATFQQDGATPHTANIVTTVLEGLSLEVWGKGVWPGISADFNPIETLESILKDYAQKPPYPTTKAELFKKFEKICESFPVTMLENLAQSFKRRVEDMMNNSGGHTKYWTKRAPNFITFHYRTKNL